MAIFDDPVLKEIERNIDLERQNQQQELKKYSLNAQKDLERRNNIKEGFKLITGREMKDIEYIEYVDLFDSAQSRGDVWIDDFGYLNLKTFCKSRGIEFK